MSQLLQTDDIWRDWARHRWFCSQIEGEEDGWLACCNKRMQILRISTLLLGQWKHRHIPCHVGRGATDAWADIVSGIVLLTSEKRDHQSRSVLRRAGGVRFFLALCVHNSHKLRRLAVGVLANILAAETEGQRNRAELASWCAALKPQISVIRPMLCSPVSSAQSLLTREAARYLVNLFFFSLKNTGISCFEHEVAYYVLVRGICNLVSHTT